MKKLFILLAAVVMAASAMADSDYLQYKDVNHQIDSSLRYKLYKTSNIWTFLKLDTRMGAIWQVQFSKDKDNTFELFLGMPDYYGHATDTVNGRYELYPTSNMWTFMLIDQIDGEVYEVQWSQEEKYRYIKKINEIKEPAAIQIQNVIRP